MFFVVVELAHLVSDKLELRIRESAEMDLQPSDFVLAPEQQGPIQVVVFVNSLLVISY